jgi:hypothetical protein
VCGNPEILCSGYFDSCWLQVSLSVAILNSTADGARQVAALYADNVISAIEQVVSPLSARF